MPPVSATTPAGALSRKASAVVQAIVAMPLGALFVGVAGFSHFDAVHNAALDTSIPDAWRGGSSSPSR